MLSFDNISKSFGSQTLFDEASFKINRGERIGLVGRNGHGKTTLFKIISGDERPDDGAISTPKNYRIGYVRQHMDFTEETVIKECVTGLPEHEKEMSWKAEKILSGLGFSQEDMTRSPHEFSGGFQVRMNLAKAIVADPDILLLDEPTNYLDITSIRWVIGFLRAWPRELMLITHDRSFMDQVATHTVGIHRGKMRKIKGDTGKFYARLAEDEEIYESTRVNDEKRRNEIELFITRFRAKARLAGMVQSRVKSLNKMEKKSKLEKVKDLEFQFREKPFNGKQMGNAVDLAFSYDSQTPLFSDLNFAIGARDRICVIGPNGKGKTTLIKLLSGALDPFEGAVHFHHAVKKGVFEQTNIQRLVDSRTVEEEILYSEPGVDRGLARDICGAMMFSGDAALKKIDVLSGGEKSRVMLGKLLAAPANLLLLDEPTNHLDMESCDSLLGAIDNFDGSVVMVTHNEMFLNALATRLIVFQNNKASLFEGTYSEFLEKNGWDEQEDGRKLPGCSSETAKNSEKNNAPEKTNKKEMRCLRSEIIAEKSKTLKPIQSRINGIEKEIEKKEEKLNELNEIIIEAYSENQGEKIGALSKEIHECQTSIDGLYDDLETFSDEIEEKQASFDCRLDALEA